MSLLDELAGANRQMLANALGKRAKQAESDVLKSVRMSAGDMSEEEAFKLNPAYYDENITRSLSRIRDILNTAPPSGGTDYAFSNTLGLPYKSRAEITEESLPDIGTALSRKPGFSGNDEFLATQLRKELEAAQHYIGARNKSKLSLTGNPDTAGLSSASQELPTVLEEIRKAQQTGQPTGELERKRSALTSVLGAQQGRFAGNASSKFEGIGEEDYRKPPGPDIVNHLTVAANEIVKNSKTEEDAQQSMADLLGQEKDRVKQEYDSLSNQIEHQLNHKPSILEAVAGVLASFTLGPERAMHLLKGGSEHDAVLQDLMIRRREAGRNLSSLAMVPSKLAAKQKSPADLLEQQQRMARRQQVMDRAMQDMTPQERADAMYELARMRGLDPKEYERGQQGMESILLNYFNRTQKH